MGVSLRSFKIKKFGATTFIGYVICSIGLALAIWSPQFLANFFVYLTLVVALFGFGFLMFTLGKEKLVIPLDPYKQLLIQRLRTLPRLNPVLLKNEWNRFLIWSTLRRYKESFIKLILRIIGGLIGKNGNQIIFFLGQTAFIGISLVLFCFMEKQTQINPRLQSLASGQFIQILTDNMVNLTLLGLGPWLLYSVVGVGFAYMTITKGRLPYLPNVIFNEEKKLPGSFFYNFMRIIVDINTLFSIIFTVAFVMFFLTETGNFFLGFKSVFSIPLLTMFIIGLLIFTLRRASHDCVDWMINNKISLGGALIFLVLGFSILMIWFYNLGEHFLTLIKEQHMLEPLKHPDLKSMPWNPPNASRQLTEDVMDRRLSLFIWGWWMIWLPWMSSFIARWSIGLSVGKALIKAVIVPVCLFTWIYWQAQVSQTANEFDFISGTLFNWLDTLEARIAVSLGLCLFIWSVWGKMRSTWALSIGAMLPIKSGKQRSLRNWMTNFLFWLAVYGSSWFSLGWLPTQVLSSFAAGFMTLLVIFFLWSLYNETKCKKSHSLVTNNHFG